MIKFRCFFSKKANLLMAFGVATYAGIHTLYPVLFTIAHQRFLKIIALPESEVTSFDHPLFRGYHAYSDAANRIGALIQSPLLWLAISVWLLYGLYRFGEIWFFRAGALLIFFSWLTVSMVTLFSRYALGVAQTGNYYELLRPATYRLFRIWLLAFLIEKIWRLIQRKDRNTEGHL